MTAPRRAVVLVTGMSGAGRVTALQILKDLGHVSVDNMPLPLLGSLLGAAAGETPPLAFGVDTRTWNFDPRELVRQAGELRARDDIECRLLFLDCDDEVLRQRYSGTKRPHPLAPDRPVADGIAAERRLMRDIRDQADLVIDTSALAPHDLRRRLSAEFAPRAAGLAIAVLSFSYPRGLPREADLVFDVRFLRNPHYVPELRPLTGRDPAVAAHVASDPDFETYISGLQAWLAPQLPRFDAEGRSYLTLAVGCTGGRHRSVAVAELLASWLRATGRSVSLTHRDAGPPSGGSATLETGNDAPPPGGAGVDR
ncbi:MAG: RNase adapter RapZ [Alphaproteobacteria bacterium]|nr:RNase adapter RapZ [Alphaproteobacteria bacterium]